MTPISEEPRRFTAGDKTVAIINNTDNVRITLTLRRVHKTIFAVEEQSVVHISVCVCVRARGFYVLVLVRCVRGRGCV